MYYLDIISAKQFQISHQPYKTHLIYVAVYYYLIVNLENSRLDNKDKQIYGEIDIVDW